MCEIMTNIKITIVSIFYVVQISDEILYGHNYSKFESLAETAMVFFYRLDAKIVYHAVVFIPKTFPIINFPISVVKRTSPVTFVYRIFCRNFNIL